MRPFRAHCHRGLGTLYATTGQADQARAALLTAIELYRAMDMMSGSRRPKRHWHRWTHDDNRRGLFSHAVLQNAQKLAHQLSPMTLRFWTSFRILSVAYAMMELRMDTEVEHQAGRRRGWTLSRWWIR